MCRSSLDNPQPIEPSGLCFRVVRPHVDRGAVKTIDTYMKDLKYLQLASIKQGFGGRRTRPLELGDKFTA